MPKLLRASVVLTPEQIANLKSVPAEIIPSPGSGLSLRVFGDGQYEIIPTDQPAKERFAALPRELHKFYDD